VHYVAGPSATATYREKHFSRISPRFSRGDWNLAFRNWVDSSNAPAIKRIPLEYSPRKPAADWIGPCDKGQVRGRGAACTWTSPCPAQTGYEPLRKTLGCTSNRPVLLSFVVHSGRHIGINQSVHLSSWGAGYRHVGHQAEIPKTQTAETKLEQLKPVTQSTNSRKPNC
jgi:hypothetical protein